MEEMTLDRQALIRTRLAERIAAGGSNLDGRTVAVKADGTVLAAGDNEDGQCNVSSWRNIVAVAVGECHTVGLRADGTVVAAGNNQAGQCDVSDWRNIIAIAAGSFHTVGLQSNGRVVAAGSNTYDQCNVGYWRDMVAISAAGYHTLGVMSDGSIDAVGFDESDEDWQDVTQLVEFGCKTYSIADHHLAGLTPDGKVMVLATEDYDEGQSATDHWRDIVAICAGFRHTAGLKADGTVVVTERVEDEDDEDEDEDEDEDKLDTSSWQDIVAIAGNGFHLVGLKSDGTLVTTGCNQSGECDLSGWKLFDSLDDLTFQPRATTAGTESSRQEAWIYQEKESKRRKNAQILEELNQQRDELTQELEGLKGLFKGKERKELQERIAALDKEINVEKELVEFWERDLK